MKALKIIGLVVAAIIIFAVLLFFVMNSEFVEGRRLKKQMESNLGIQIKNPLVLLSKRSYGWAEEGGDKALIQISAEDCSTLLSLLTSEESFSQTAEYASFFQEQGISPKVVRTLFVAKEHGDFVNYAMDKGSCVLYRNYHYE